MTSQRRAAAVVRAAEIEAASRTFRHPWNPRSELHAAHLSGLGGLRRTGLSIAVLPPGRESFDEHAHWIEEEWIYLLDGRAVARIDGEEIELGAGDFVAFPTPSVPHLLCNPFDRPVRYLMGGESRDCEVADFPRLGRRMFRQHGQVEWAPLEAFERMSFESADDEEE